MFRIVGGNAQAPPAALRARGRAALEDGKAFPGWLVVVDSPL